MVINRGLAKLKKYRRETFYTVIVFVLMQFAVIAYELAVNGLFLYSAAVGVWLIFAWSLFTYLNHGRRKVSKYSEVFVNLKLWNRVFPYFITPILLVISTFAFLYLSKNPVLRQFVIVTSSVYLWAVLVHIKKSYKEHHSVDGFTRIMFKFVDIFVFYMATTVIYSLAIDWISKVILVIILSVVLLMHQLRLYKQGGLHSYVVLAISALAIAIAAWLTASLSILIAPLVLSVIFYCVVALWYTRLSGSISFDDYITPVLFALMGLIVVLSF